MAKVIAVCRSDLQGVSKSPVDSAILKVNHGLVGDAHACPEDPKREISLLALESIEKFNKTGFTFQPGDFAENLTTAGIQLNLLPIGTCLRVGKEVILKVTQIGKKCHTGCAIFQKAGCCIMPKEGIFALVMQGGIVKPGDSIMVFID